MHDRKHLCHFGKARGRIELSMIVPYFQCLTLRVRSGHLSNALTRERSWLTEKLISPPYQLVVVVVVCCFSLPHRLLAFSQNVRPGEGSVPTGPTTGKLQSLMTSRAEKGTQDLMRWCMTRKHLCHFGKARGRIELSMIVTYFQCLTLRVRSGHLSNALTRERSWLTEKLISPPYQLVVVVVVCCFSLPHRLLAFSQNVRPGEGSVPTGPTTGKLQSLMTSRAEKGTQDLMRWCMIESIFVILGRLGAESSWVWLSHTFSAWPCESGVAT